MPAAYVLADVVVSASTEPDLRRGSLSRPAAMVARSSPPLSGGAPLDNRPLSLPAGSFLGGPQRDPADWPARRRGAGARPRRSWRRFAGARVRRPRPAIPADLSARGTTGL